MTIRLPTYDILSAITEYIKSVFAKYYYQGYTVM